MKALVTGSGSGLGKEIAIYLSSLGYELILVGRAEKELNLTKKLCNNSSIYICDLSKENEVFKLYENNKDIDFLVNNAGFGLYGDFIDTDLNKELEMIDVNIKAVHILTKLYAQIMNKGYILNVSSVAGFNSGPKMSTYYATKNYVLKLSLAINQELKDKNSAVHISVLCPGSFDSKFNKSAGLNSVNKGLSSKEIAYLAINKTLKKKMIIIPGFKWKLLVFFSKFIPIRLNMIIINKFQESKNHKQ